MVHEYWHPMNDPRPGGRYVNSNWPQETPDNPTGSRPGRNIEDAEREPMANFLFGDSGHGHFQSLQDLMASKKFRFAKAAPGSSADVRSTDAAEEEYIIDPITNRKRPRSPSDRSLPASDKQTFNSSKSRTTEYDIFRTDGAQEPIFYDGPPPESELQKYDQVKIDPMPWDQIDTQEKPTATRDRKPVFESEEYVRNHSEASANPTPEGFLGWQHQGVSWFGNDGIVPPSDSATGGKGNVERWSLNPDYFRSEFFDRHSPSRHNENVTTQTSARKYDDLHKYKPVMVNEDQETPAEPPMEYDDLSKYSDAFKYQEPDGKPLVEEPPPMPELEKYQPFQHNEPNGTPASYDDPKADQAELNKYQAFRYNEPHGKSPAAEETNDCDPAELRKYRPFMYNEPDGKTPGYVEEGNEYDPKELQKYGAFRYNEPDGKPPILAEETSEVPPNELEKYGPVRHNEPDGKPLTEPSDGPHPGELNRYIAVRWNEPDGKPAVKEDKITQSLEDFELKPRDVEQSSKPVVSRTFPANYVSEQEKAEDLDLLRASDVRAAAGLVQPATETPEERSNHRKMLESLMTSQSAVSDAVDSKAFSALRESRLKTSLDPEHRQNERKLTGNYVQDFPEDFEKSWTAEITPDAGLLPKGGLADTSSYATAAEPTTSPLEQEIQKAEREQVEGAVFDSSAALQPALDRQRTFSRTYSSRGAPEEAIIDPYSKEPQGLETSYAEECAGQPTWPTYIRHYESVNAKPESTPEETGAMDGTMHEPTLYKILAYDPTMQRINVAETSSAVTDSSGPMTPAEVLLHLSNPAKFLPHFRPLEAQGFEIASGSGDVLVFRKVRPATAEPAQPDAAAETALPSAPATGGDSSSAPPINPIDMTGEGQRNFPSPATSMFASPTGFVNYDLPPLGESSAKSTPRFVSGIDVRREEPVFSGGKAERQSGTKKKLPKRIAVGAAWVAGVSYALGVMGEYFKTGGADGNGPKGL